MSRKRHLVALGLGVVALGLLASSDAPPATVPAEPGPRPEPADPHSPHVFGRDVLEQVWPQMFGRDATPAERQMVQAVSWGEGGYGRASYKRRSIPDGAVIDVINDSNNWGAVQCSTRPPCPEGACFTATDTSPRLVSPENPKGYYDACFRRHATPEEGAAAYLTTLLVKRPSVAAVIGSGSARAVADAMYRTRYYESHGATDAERIENYAQAIARHATEVAEALGEPLLVTLDGPGGIA